MKRLIGIILILAAFALASFGQDLGAAHITNPPAISSQLTTNQATPAAVVAAASTQTNLPPTAVSPAGGSPFDSNGLWVFLIPILVPLIFGVTKQFASKLPLWTIPLIAPFLGAALDASAAFLLGNQASPILSSLLGSAGVGLRELKDQLQQLKQRNTDGKTGIS